MTLPEVCIKRPVFATVLSLAILLLGAISYSRMAVRDSMRNSSTSSRLAEKS